MTALSVLVVEDDALIGMLLAEMLEEMGYGVCAIAATEEDAVANAARHKPGLMIVDEHLREGNGVSAVNRILRAGPLPCVFISGAPTYPGRPGARVLQKPFLEADLIRAIRSVIGPGDAPEGHPSTPPHMLIGH
ncbi:MAG: two-component system, response regulator PdtaR [Acetobacteraceae bacterium]|jgi:CheY-like chemotaxis protein|nr:two-component system, response regulator PdtaR [Acetobacteraceae bacterium]